MNATITATGTALDYRTAPDGTILDVTITTQWMIEPGKVGQELISRIEIDGDVYYTTDGIAARDLITSIANGTVEADGWNATYDLGDGYIPLMAR